MSENNNKFPGENNTGHIWDEDIRELDNRPPRWYMWSFYFSIIMVIAYAFYYPAIPWFDSHSKGSANWTQIKEYKESVQELEAIRKKRFAKIEQDIKEKSLSEILNDSELTNYAIKTSKTIFGDNCATCHGAGGQGNIGFPILADDDWLYGGSIDNIHTSIINGRKSIMPAHKDMLTEKELDTLADFVLLDNKKESPEGMKLYQTKGCIACHGATLEGNKYLGGANLTDKIWRFKHKDQKAEIKKTIAYGVNIPGSSNSQNAVMPAFGNSKLIDKQQVKKLAIFVHQLGGGK